MTVTSIARQRRQLTGQEKAIRARADKMAALFMRGIKLERIAADFGTTAERAKSTILRNSSYPTAVLLENRKAAIAEAKRRRAAQLADLSRDGVDVAAVQQWSRDNLGTPMAEAAAKFGITQAQVAAILGSRRLIHAKAHTTRDKVWTDEQLLDRVRAFITATGKTGSKEFGRWSRAANGPAQHTVIHRFAGWNNALALAGMEDAPDPIKQRRRYTDNDLWAAVVEYLADQRTAYTFAGYHQWHTVTIGSPSPSVLRTQLGTSWVTLRQTGLKAITRHPDLDPEWLADITTRRDWATFRAEQTLREAAIATVKAAIADLGPTATYRQYHAWREDKDQPHGCTLLRNAGMSWRELVTAAGGTAAAVRRGKWTDDAVLAAVRTFLVEHPTGSSDKYRRWASGTSDRPAVGTVIEHYQSWRNAVAQARGDIEEIAS